MLTFRFTFKLHQRLRYFTSSFSHLFHFSPRFFAKPISGKYTATTQDTWDTIPHLDSAMLEFILIFAFTFVLGFLLVLLFYPIFQSLIGPSVSAIFLFPLPTCIFFLLKGDCNQYEIFRIFCIFCQFCACTAFYLLYKARQFLA